MELPPKYASAVLQLDKIKTKNKEKKTPQKHIQNKNKKQNRLTVFNFKWLIVEYSRINHYDVTQEKMHEPESE